MAIPRLLDALLRLPTAPFVEQDVQAYVEGVLAPLPNVTTTRDRHGNICAHYRHLPPARQPFAFVAHMDHPGFVALEMVEALTVRAAFRGGVKTEYFAGAGVRFHADGRWIRGHVRELVRTEQLPGPAGTVERPVEALVDLQAPVPEGTLGMWDLPEPRLRGDRLSARACDDIAGVAAILALLERLAQKQAAAEVYALFTRAEEVGFVGAIAAAREETLPRNVAVISVETSSERGNARRGDGPILRVGDRGAVFTPALVAYGDRVGRELAARQPGFAYQRRLMDGGLCEAIPFIAYGYAAAGVCVALGNYHNMDVRRRKIGSEAISLRDWLRMVDYFEALATDPASPDAMADEFAEKLGARFEKYAHLL